MSDKVMNKDQWVQLFREIGLDDETMLRWHRAFSQHNEWHTDVNDWPGSKKIRAFQTHAPLLRFHWHFVTQWQEQIQLPAVFRC